jgi:assimilatory nitrate reductase catalytic subunit
VKGSALGETVGLEGRLLARCCARKRACAKSWDEALDKVAQGFARIIAEHGPGRGGAVRLGPVADRGLLRRQQVHEGLHRQRQHRHQFAPVHVVGRGRHKRAFGEDIVPGCYDDFELADLVVLVGRTRPGAIRPCTSASRAPRKQRPQMKVVVIDPRRTATCDLADLHLPVKAGTDVWLFNGLLAIWPRRGAVDPIRRAHTAGLDERWKRPARRAAIRPTWPRPAASNCRCCWPSTSCSPKPKRPSPPSRWA